MKTIASAPDGAAAETGPSASMNPDKETAMKRVLAVLAAMVLWTLSSGPSHAQKWASAAPVPQGAEEVYGIASGGKLYVFGGLALAWKPIGMVMEYDPATDRWTRKRDMPAYHHHFALAESNGRIYMFGGFRLPDSGRPTWIPVDNAWEYDPKADAWKALAPVPAARGSANALVVDGRIHLIGGATLPTGTKEEWLHPSRNVSVGTHLVYDPAANAWSKRADMPTPRNHAAAGVIDGRIYVAGGRAGSVFIPNALNLDLVEEYNPATDQWVLRAPMPTPRSATTWGVHNGRLYVAGGEIRHRDFWATYTTVEAFDPRSNTWTRLPPMPLPRHGLAGGVVGDRFHLVNGSVQSGTNIPGLVTSTDRHDVLILGGN
jgi:N-acetylneuraminic acid mutarotase